MDFRIVPDVVGSAANLGIDAMKPTFMDAARTVYGRAAPIAVATMAICSVLLVIIVWFIAHKAWIDFALH